MSRMLHPDIQVIAETFASLEPILDERTRRLWAAAEAHAIGRGGIARVAEATGLSRTTIRSGLGEFPPHRPLLSRAGRREDTAARERAEPPGRA